MARGLPQALAAMRDCASTARFCARDQGGAASPNDRRPLADYYFVLGVPPDATETERVAFDTYVASLLAKLT